MAQLYFLDSGMLIHHGLASMAYQAWEDYNPAIHGISTSTQELPANHPMLGKPWFFIPTLNKFYNRNDGLHPILTAISEEFTAQRWEEIELAIDEMGNPNKDLETGRYQKVKSKFEKIENKGDITTTELNTILAILNQFVP